MLTNYLYRHQSRLVYFNITTNSSMSKKEIFHKSILCKMIFQKSGSLQLLHHVTTSNRPFVHLGNNFVQNSSYFHSLIGRNFLLLNIIIFVQKNISWCRYSRSSFFFFYPNILCYRMALSVHNSFHPVCQMVTWYSFFPTITSPILPPPSMKRSPPPLPSLLWTSPWTSA